MDKNTLSNIAANYIVTAESINGLHSRSMMLSTEDLSVYIHGIKKFFVTGLNSVATIFGNNFKNDLPVVNEKEYNTFVKTVINLSKEIDTLHTLQYSEVAKIKVPVLVGMSVDFEKAFAMLKTAMIEIHTKFDSILDYTDTYIALMISDSDFRKSARVDNVKILNGLKSKESIKYLKKGSDDIIDYYYTLDDIIRKMIDSKSYIDQKSIDTLVPNLGTIKDIYSNVLDVTKNITTDTYTKYAEYDKKIYERVDTLIAIMNEDKDMVVAKPVINELARVIEDTARAITATVTIFEIMNKTVASYTAMIDRLTIYKKNK